MKKILFTTISFLIGASSFAQNEDSIMFKRISNQILNEGKCYDNLRVLCKQIGHRLSGSRASLDAVQWGVETLKEAGCDKVWLQPVKVPVWHRGNESLEIKFAKGEGFIKVPMTSMGNSEGTKGRRVQANILMVHSFEELKALSKEDVEGKILFFNYPFKQDFVMTFKGYSDAVKYRWQSPILAAAYNPKAIIIRSVSTGKDDFPHTGSTKYADEGFKIPIVGIGNYTADKLAIACNKGAVEAALKSECTMLGEALSYNVIGEIKGSSKHKDYMLVGGHLDSWDVGEGAHDDGAGCVQSIEVLRCFKNLGIRPKRTIRAVLFMNEENGLRGGQAYADSALARNEHHSLALESDAGGFSPRGIETTMSKAQREKFKPYIPLFLPYGVYSFDGHGGGADVSPLEKQNVVIGELLPDSQRYFDVHHSNNDVFENVNHRELKLGAAAMAMMLYIVDKYDITD